MDQAYEARFEAKLRQKKLEVDLGPAESEFQKDQVVQKKELRLLDYKLYTLKRDEIPKDEGAEWYFSGTTHGWKVSGMKEERGLSRHQRPSLEWVSCTSC